MIRDWRSRFGVGDFGFHIVSLANFQAASDAPQDSAWAELREAQALTARSLPHCGLAIAIDIGEAGDIHPKNKAEIGRRLALSALALTYGKPVEWSGPWYRSMETAGQGIRLSFDHAKGGLIAKGKQPTGFRLGRRRDRGRYRDGVLARRRQTRRRALRLGFEPGLQFVQP
jgi:sialate O-acetylesterase